MGAASARRCRVALVYTPVAEPVRVQNAGAPPRAEGRGGGDDKASFPWGFTVAAGTPAARARRWRCVGMGGVGKHIPYDSDMISYRPQ